MSWIEFGRHSFPGLNGFDCFVLAGAAMNLVVIVCLVGFWLSS